MIRGPRVGVVAVVAAAAALAACGEPAGDDTVDDPQSGMSSVRFRLWDEAAASAYQESFDAFNAIHRDIHVEVEVVSQDSYATRAAADFASGAMADVFWVSSDALGDWVDLTDLVAPASEVDQEEVAWSPAMVDLFTEDTELWAVPQLWETSTLYANTEKGRRPSWNAAAPRPVAEPLVDAVADALRRLGATVATGVFGARMAVELVNDGPVTVMLEL